VLVGISQALLLTAIGVVGYLAWTNYDRAEQWQRRAETLERNAHSLNDILIERSETLNERTRDLNEMAAIVRASSRALRRSEADVVSLAKRQRELAAEKARVEDARAQLAVEAAAVTDVASAFIDCKDGLVDLLGYVSNEDYSSANYYWQSVSDDCDHAEYSLSGYLTTYGG
jgi:hypothetical protein